VVVNPGDDGEGTPVDVVEVNPGDDLEGEPGDDLEGEPGDDLEEKHDGDGEGRQDDDGGFAVRGGGLGELDDVPRSAKSSPKAAGPESVQLIGMLTLLAIPESLGPPHPPRLPPPNSAQDLSPC
jgi:hypothetical protein